MKEEKTALKRLFNYDLNQASPVHDDFTRKVQYDEDGKEFVVYEKVDYPKFQQSLGNVGDWNLNALLKAGINPDFPIHTGNPTRIEGIDSVAQYQAMADEIFAQEENKSE